MCIDLSIPRRSAFAASAVSSKTAPQHHRCVGGMCSRMCSSASSATSATILRELRPSLLLAPRLGPARRAQPPWPAATSSVRPPLAATQLSCFRLLRRRVLSPLAATAAVLPPPSRRRRRQNNWPASPPSPAADPQPRRSRRRRPPPPPTAAAPAAARHPRAFTPSGSSAASATGRIASRAPTPLTPQLGAAADAPPARVAT